VGVRHGRLEGEGAGHEGNIVPLKKSPYPSDGGSRGVRRGACVRHNAGADAR
jgi:hypothetical protein